MMIHGKMHRNNPGNQTYIRKGAVAACILMTVLLMAGFPALAGAHSPKEVALSYDQAKKTLEVRITHGVDDPMKHFIDQVEIRKDGKTISKVEYKNQPGETTFLYSYPVDVAAGDVLEVKASCSRFGSKTEKLTVAK